MKLEKIPRELEAKLIVLEAFRAGPIENIHAGKHRDIPPDVSRISNKEMKQLNKYSVDKMNFILWLRDERPKQYKLWLQLRKNFSSIDNWDAPRDPEEMLKELLDCSEKEL
jgi:hypothetical protein